MSLIGQEPKEKINATFARHVSSGKAAFYAQAGIDFIIGKREGVYVWDLEGHRLINCHSNGGVFNKSMPRNKMPSVRKRGVILLK